MTHTALAVELGFDPAADAAVRALWEDLAEAGISSSMSQLGIHPHITLAVYEAAEDAVSPLLADPAQLGARLAAFAAGLRPIELSLAIVGAFPGPEGVVFLAPKVTRALLTAQARYHLRCADLAPACWPHYRPRRWVPHCTLATGLTPEGIGAAIARCMDAPLPIQARLTSLGIVRFRPGERLAVERVWGVGLGASDEPAASTPQQQRLSSLPIKT